MDEKEYQRDYKAILYPNASHLIGMMPSRERNKWLYRMLPFIGLMYRTLGEHRVECMKAFIESEKEIVNWINESKVL